MQAMVPIGGAILSIGVGLLALLNPDTNYGLIFLFEVIVGVGVGPEFSVGSVVVQNSVPVADMVRLRVLIPRLLMCLVCRRMR